MGDKSNIEWTDATWNAIRGCSRVSPGCDHCYAIRDARRSDRPGGAYEGLTTIRKGKLDWSGFVRLVPSKLGEPLRWRRPRRIFVNSMSDLFHESLANEEIAALFGVMAASPRHTFQILTKRAKRMRDWFRWIEASARASEVSTWTECHSWALQAEVEADEDDSVHKRSEGMPGDPWPLPNVLLGVSAENQEQADKRIPELLATPAAVRFVSAEPLLGPLNIYPGWCKPHTSSNLDDRAGGGAWSRTDHAKLNWVIVGGESGHGARPCNPDWIRDIVRRCRTNNVACFVKQLGADYASACGFVHSKGGNPAEWPRDLRVQQFPEL